VPGQPTIERNATASAIAVWITAYVLKHGRTQYRVSLTDEPHREGWEVVEQHPICLESSTDVSKLSAEVDRFCEKPLRRDQVASLLARIRGQVPLTNEPLDRTDPYTSFYQIVFRAVAILILFGLFSNHVLALALLFLLDSSWRTVSVLADERSSLGRRRLHIISSLFAVAVVAIVATGPVGKLSFLVILLVALAPWELAIWWEKRNRKLSGIRQPEATGPA